ncbi:MAG TPA: type I methionyl aminopeptidase [Candidatus Omnitrophica bacterium]|nr:type I methionyl aminopeptidase [Candidatus Omnitrophota bacterium]
MIQLKSEADIEEMRQAGRIVARVFRDIESSVVVGISTKKLDDLIKEGVEKQGGLCAFLGYRSYPANSCISINEEVVHGIPSENIIVEDGDIVSIDIGVKLSDYFADAAITVSVGNIDPKRKKLMDTTKKALALGIKEARVGNYLSDISYAIQQYAESKGFSVVRDFAGHGIGKELHEEPEIPNFGKRGSGIKLKKGMVFAIEPMVNAGTWQVEIASDGWTVLTKDRQLSAHFEHTVAILDDGPEILTRI